jgi:hypothetical protein
VIFSFSKRKQTKAATFPFCFCDLSNRLHPEMKSQLMVEEKFMRNEWAEKNDRLQEMQKL